MIVAVVVEAETHNSNVAKRRCRSENISCGELRVHESKLGARDHKRTLVPFIGKANAKESRSAKIKRMYGPDRSCLFRRAPYMGVSAERILTVSIS